MKMSLLVIFALMLLSCGGQEMTSQQYEGGLRKIVAPSDAQIQALRDAGAEIVVLEPDYVIYRATDTTQPVALSTAPIQEKDLVQRLVHIYLPDSTALQTVVNTGVDLWQVQGDTAVARAFDLYIDKMVAAGLSVRVVAADASKWMEGRP